MLKSSDAEWECSVEKLNPSRQILTCIPCFHSCPSPICLFKVANYHLCLIRTCLLQGEIAPSSSTHRQSRELWFLSLSLNKMCLWGSICLLFFIPCSEGNKNCMWHKAPAMFVSLVRVLCFPWKLFSFLFPWMWGGKRCTVDSCVHFAKLAWKQLCRKGSGSPRGQWSWPWASDVPLCSESWWHPGLH